MSRTATLTLALALAAGAAVAQDASATLRNTAGEEIGTATLTATASGRTLVVVEATGVPQGVHGLHVHETGDCSADDFSSAGGHLAGNADHGVMADGGPHPGDMPNAHVQGDGVLAVEVFKSNLPLDDLLLDDDGSAVIIHSGADDYESQPSGAGRQDRLRRNRTDVSSRRAAAGPPPATARGVVRRRSRSRRDLPAECLPERSLRRQT